MGGSGPGEDADYVQTFFSSGNDEKDEAEDATSSSSSSGFRSKAAVQEPPPAAGGVVHQVPAVPSTDTAGDDDGDAVPSADPAGDDDGDRPGHGNRGQIPGATTCYWHGFKVTRTFNDLLQPEGFEMTCYHRHHKCKRGCRRTRMFRKHGSEEVVFRKLKWWALQCMECEDQIRHQRAPSPSLPDLPTHEQLDEACTMVGPQLDEACQRLEAPRQK